MTSVQQTAAAQDDAVRKAIKDAMRAKGLTASVMSRRMGRSHSYMQQFLKYGKPRELDYRDALKVKSILAGRSRHRKAEPPQSIHALVHRATQVLDAVWDKGDENDLTPRQFTVLLAIKANQPCSQTDLVGSTGIDRSTLADIVRRLVKHNLVQRRRTKEDAREYAVRVTAGGLGALEAGGLLQARVIAAINAKLTKSEQAQLRSALSRLASIKISEE